MATINAEDLAQNIVDWAGDVPWALAIAGGALLLTRALAEFGSNFSSLSEGEAVTVFALVAGVAGGLAQWISAQQLGQLSRQINVLELLPAVLAIIAATVFLTKAMLPPSPIGQGIREFLVKAGLV